ncbi:hypothetical protein V8E53_010445 [Lactarius tabidus]
MVAPSPSLSCSQVAARGSRSAFTSLCAHGTWCTLKADVRSFSFAAVSNTTTAAQTGKSPARTVASPRLIAIVGGAVGAVVALAAVLALVHVLRVRRKVERFRRSMNVLGPELMPMPMPTLRSPDEVASIGPVAMSQVSPGARSSLVSGTRPTSVRTMDYKRHSYLSDSTTATSPIRPPRRYPLPPGKLSIDVDVARAFQSGFHLPTIPHTPMRSPYGDVVPSPGPTYEYFPRHEVHSAVTQCATEHLMTLS